MKSPASEQGRQPGWCNGLPLALAVCLGLLMAGCNGGDTEPKNNTGQTSRKAPVDQPDLQQPAPPSSKSIKPDPGGDLNLPPAGSTPDGSGDTVLRDNPGNAGSPSALDEAIRNINQDPVTDVASMPEIEPAEPHHELLPLLEEHWVRLHPGMEVWFDPENNRVAAGGRICFREGPLEMFACPMHTKEHESIVATVSNAEIIHTGLLAAGAQPGKPFQWDPQYVPASGPVIGIMVKWTEDGQTVERRAQEMIMDILSKKTLQDDWVFCGSGEWVDPDDPGYREYWADSGDMICVTNFTTAMLDLQVESSSLQDGLRYHANPEMIPPLGKPVLLILTPQPPATPAVGEQPAPRGN